MSRSRAKEGPITENDSIDNLWEQSGYRAPFLWEPCVAQDVPMGWTEASGPTLFYVYKVMPCKDIYTSYWEQPCC